MAAWGWWHTETGEYVDLEARNSIDLYSVILKVRKDLEETCRVEAAFSTPAKFVKNNESRTSEAPKASESEGKKI